MKYRSLCFALMLLLVSAQMFGQSNTSKDSVALVALNQRIDDLVVLHDTASLLSLYAPDFVFSHGSGKIEGRSSWFVSVAKGNYTRRQHDSVRVEMHKNLAIVRGKLNVSKKSKTNLDHYYLWYIRVYAYTKRQWKMISHTTYYEVHLPSTQL